MTERPTSSSGLVLYQTEDGRTRLEYRFEDEMLSELRFYQKGLDIYPSVDHVPTRNFHRSPSQPVCAASKRAMI